MSRHRSITAALLAVLIASPLAAQANQPVATADSPTIVAASPAANAIAAPAAEALPSFAPTLANAAVGIRSHATAPATTPAPFQDRVGRNPAMMIVGAVALIAGSFIDGDAGTIIMIAGGGLGLYGLWQYLK